MYQKSSPYFQLEYPCINDELLGNAERGTLGAQGFEQSSENSHQPTRGREQRMRRFKSPGQAQRFLSAFGLIRDHFHPKQHHLTAQCYREQLRQRFEDWREVFRDFQTTD